MLPGIPLETMDKELASLSRPTEEHFRRAMAARASGNGDGMEVELKAVLEDVASPRFYEASIALAQHLDATGRPSDALMVLDRLQWRFPAFPEPYRLEAMLHRHRGNEEAAREVLRRGITYCPQDRRLREILSQLQSSG
jgi:hypothetical protein